MSSRVDAVEENLDRFLAEASPAAVALADDDPLRAGTTLTARTARELFEDQITSRALDVAARRLRARGQGYYTISSAGHEQNAVVGAQLRLTDPCFLHYRSGAFMMARSRLDPAVDPVRDTLLSVAAAADDPIAGGRHKVWGSRRLWVPPQTSTIASHIPKAVGTAFGLSRLRRTAMATDLAADSLVCCSLGDASVNHATALSGINAARYAHRRGSPTPILFVCEDNGLGISVETPRRWIAATFGDLAHLHYVLADGDLDEVWDRVEEAVTVCRERRAPVFLHLKTVRLWGHAGSDVEAGYRGAEEIAADERDDPVLRNARRLVASGAATPEELASTVARIRTQVSEQTREVGGSRTLASAAEVMAPLAPDDRERARREATGRPGRDARLEHFEGTLPEDVTAPPRRTLAAHINATLHDEMLRRDEMLVFGEDVARKGGVYHVTAGLLDHFGIERVFDTLLDETTILGTAQGTALLGFLPVPEIQYLAYAHNALDQLRGEAASLSFFSSRQFRNPMVVRIAAFAYQKGFGGHFHNDNAIGAFRDIPGLLLAAPARGDDAARMLRGLLGMAKANGRVACFLEPIALYHERDLYEDGDEGWLTTYPPPGDALLPGEVGVYHEEASDVLVVSYANGLRMSLRAARRLEKDGIAARVLDLRWLSPLPLDAVRRHAAACGRVLVADECRASGGGVADAIVAALVEGGFTGQVASVRSADSYVPLGPAAGHVLLHEDTILAAARRLARGPSDPRNGVTTGPEAAPEP